MVILAILVIVTAILWGAHRILGVGPRDRSPAWPWRMRWAMAAALLFAGIDHLVTPARYLPMMPDYIPWHGEIVFLTGVCEIAGAAGLLVPQTRRLAGWALAVYFVCVLPANVQNLLNALDGATAPGLPTAPWYYVLRLALQPVFIVWVLAAAEIIRLPGRARTDPPPAA